MADRIDTHTWTVQKDYDGQSQHYYCSNCGLPHRNGSDEVVLRGNWIEMEGFYDICIDCARAAGFAVGLVEEGKQESLQLDLIERLRAENESLHDLIAHFRSLLDGSE